MAKNAMPVSKAKTAYGLLSEIRKLILEEPKRYDQEDFLSTGDRVQRTYGDYAPACGTVGCVAGWVTALKGDPSKETIPQATSILALNGDFYEYDGPAYELFKGNAAGSRFSEVSYEQSLARIRAHAKRGAAHIAKFQKKYAKQLKAKKV